MIDDFFVKHSCVDKPNGYPEWFTILIDNVKNSKCLSLDDSVWFITRPHTPDELSSANPDDNPIINNWVFFLTVVFRDRPTNPKPILKQPLIPIKESIFMEFPKFGL